MDLTGLGSLADFGGKVLDKLTAYFPDQASKDAAKLEILKMQQSGELAAMAAETDLAKAQIAVNAVEAASGSLFVAGWRPWIGWICGVAFGYAAILEPLMRFVATVIYKYTGAFPVIDTVLTLQVLLGMLGLGVMRSWDKGKGVTK
jgi:hypothetical protein